MANVDPWFKCYPDELLTGMRDLKANEQAIYVQIILRIYDSGRPIREDYRMIGSWIRSNARVAKPVIETLIAKGHIIRLDDGGLADERALNRVQARLQERNKKKTKPFDAVFYKKNPNVSQNLESGIAKHKQSFPIDSQLNCELSAESPLESKSFKEPEIERKKACTGAYANTTADDRTEAISLEAMASHCKTAEQFRALEMMHDCATGIFGRTVIFERPFAANYISESLGLVLKQHGLAVAVRGSREANKAAQEAGT